MNTDMGQSSMTTPQRTEWRCPWCLVDFNINEGTEAELDRIVEGHIDAETRSAKAEYVSGLGHIEIPEKECKVCTAVAVWIVTPAALCEHDTEEPSYLCEKHKTQAMHPSYRMSCARCLDDSGVHSEMWVGSTERIYRTTLEGN